MPSTADTMLECGSLILATIIAYKNGDITKLLSIKPESFWSIIPLGGVSSMTLIASEEFKVNLVEYGFSSKSLTLITLSHLVIATFLTISCLQGIRALIEKKRGQ
jgi:hypothetical protein